MTNTQTVAVIVAVLAVALFAMTAVFVNDGSSLTQGTSSYLSMDDAQKKPVEEVIPFNENYYEQFKSVPRDKGNTSPGETK